MSDSPSQIELSIHELEKIGATLPEPTKRKVRELLLKSLSDIQLERAPVDVQDKAAELKKRAELALSFGHQLQTEVLDRVRARYGRCFLILGIVIIGAVILHWCWPNLYAWIPDHTQSGLAKIKAKHYAWCVGWVFIGFSAIAFRSSKKFHANRATRIYPFFYLPVLLLIASAVLGVLAAVGTRMDYAFFYIAAPVSAALGFAADQVIGKVLRLELPFSV